MPRGTALGMVTQLPSSDETSISKKQLLARLDVCMGGRVAEEIIFGQDNITTGASSDLQTATELAQYMVLHFDCVSKLIHFSDIGFDGRSFKMYNQHLSFASLSLLEFCLISFLQVSNGCCFSSSMLFLINYEGVELWDE